MGISDFLRRHRRKLLVAVGLSASAYWVYNYLEDKLRELKESILFERLSREEMEKQFEQNQRDATFTTLALLPSVSGHIMQRYDVEATQRELKMLRSGNSGSGSGSSSAAADSSLDDSVSGTAPSQLGDSTYVSAGVTKGELWNRVKMQSVSRAFLLIYVDALLVVFTRVQLNVLGRIAYADTLKRALAQQRGTARVLDSQQQQQLDDEQCSQYLTLSWWLLNRGWELLAGHVERAVERELGDVDPTSAISFEQLNQLLGRVHQEIDGHHAAPSTLLPPPELCTYVLSQIPGREVEVVDARLEELIAETREIVGSTSCASVVQRLVHAGLSVFMGKVRALYGEEENEKENEKEEQQQEQQQQHGAGSARLAQVLLLASKQAHEMAAGSPLTNEYIASMAEGVPELDALCARVYANFELA